MIYISNALYVTAGIGPDYNENNPIIGYHSIITPSNLSVTGDMNLEVRPVENAWSPDTYTAWEGGIYMGPPADKVIYLNIANPNAENIDYIGIAKHNIGSGEYQFSIEESNDNANWTVLVSPKTVPDDRAIVEYFDTTNSLYFRLKFFKANSALFPSVIISHVKAGRALVLQRRIYVGHRPASLTSMVRRQVLNSENGQYIGQIVKSRFNKTSCEQENVTPEYVRDKIVPFMKHVNGEVEINNTAPSTFFFAWRPSDYPDEVVYGWTNDNIQPENQGNDMLGGRMRFSFNIEAVE